ncbi:MAG: 2,3-oxidosqualene cyclase [Deltaproteobacteria bacterium]|nr:2,3-oxidosqualene cyclase [Deltaproteobacteria bacterium]
MVPDSATVTVASSLSSRAHEGYDQALAYLSTRQHADGRVAGEVVWNPMLPCQYVMLCHMMGRPIDPARARRVYRSLQVQRCDDGGWGMHPDSPSYLFHTVLGYVTLRLLGYGHDDPLVADSLRYIRAHGGVYEVPTWGRVWLAMLGLYPWDSVQPILPELWLLPEASPLHPWRLYCHMRLIYLGLSYLYGLRYSCNSDETIEAIRGELYPEGYDPARFARHRDKIADTDLYEPISRGLSAAFSAMRVAERLVPRRLRKRALARALDHIEFEFRSTGHVCLSPVNGMLFILSLHATDPNHPDLERAMAGLEYWVWEDEEEGLRIAGARSDIWDTAFMVQALCEGPDHPRAEQMVRRACRWLPTAQIQQEILGGHRHYREPAYGGWGFANEDHPWPVSDCTAEALEALMRAEARGFSDPAGRLPVGRKLAALEFILRRQNDDGGFGSYEPRRGPMVLRRYNPAEIYGNCMLEYSYTECTGTCVRGLAYAERQLGDAIPRGLRSQVRQAVELGSQALLTAQHETGGWLGFWGINVTYGTLFASAGLHAAGLSSMHPSIVRGARWLVEAQRADGGWAESYEGLLRDAPVSVPDDEPSNVTQTAWALLTLLEVAPHEREAIDRGVAWLLSRQDETGGWPSERATGVFFNTAVLDYRLYRHVFPAWALARYLAHVSG